MRIAICDDESAQHDTLTVLITEYAQSKPDLTVSLSSFSSGKELLNYVDEHEGFDLYILDVIMPEMNGIQLGAALRNRNKYEMIVYLTSSPDFALDSYNVDALHYLLKPVDKDSFFHVMDKAVAHFFNQKKEVVSIKTTDSVRLMPITNIRYAVRSSRQICYDLADNTTISSMTFNGTFKDAVAPLLAHKGFLLVGSSYVVNLLHVTEITKTDMILTDGQLIPIPRRKYDLVKSEWASYWLKGANNHVI